MVRLLGLLLLAAGPAWAGFHAAARLARRPRVLRELAAALEEMGREVSFCLTPLPELFARLADGREGPVGALFARCAAGLDGLEACSMGAIWRSAIREAGLDLDSRSGRALEELGSALGRCGGADLAAALEQTAEELRAAAETAARETEQKGRMDRVLGLTAGAALVILLW